MKVPSINKTETLVLGALSKERYGLEIIEKVTEISHGKVKLTLGGVYTTLHRMERKGLLEGRWGESTEVREGARRKYYRRTGLGSKALSQEAETMYNAMIGFKPVYGGA
jgi:PadR family transcriptional regulator, regulatory protein PadR